MSMAINSVLSTFASSAVTTVLEVAAILSISICLFSVWFSLSFATTSTLSEDIENPIDIMIIPSVAKTELIIFPLFKFVTSLFFVTLSL